MNQSGAVYRLVYVTATKEIKGCPERHNHMKTPKYLINKAYR